MNKSYEDLKVWEKAIDLAEIIYLESKSFPKEDLYGITSQVRRCSVSISSNIAEGCARNNPKEFIYFIGIAQGSLAETKTQIIICKRIRLITSDEKYNKVINIIDDIGKMLNGLKRSLISNQ